MNHTEVHSAAGAAIWQDYLELTKPRVVALIVLTSVVGSLLATPATPWRCACSVSRSLT